jgi:hypothetical protein
MDGGAGARPRWTKMGEADSRSDSWMVLSKGTMWGPDGAAEMLPKGCEEASLEGTSSYGESSESHEST